jgi:putative Mg2+ transporter-C (MgtC) family protein
VGASCHYARRAADDCRNFRIVMASIVGALAWASPKWPAETFEQEGSASMGGLGSTHLGEWELVLRLALSALLGSLVGIERERQAWAAGMRTHMLVSVGACLIMIVSAFGFSDVLGARNVTLDPSRIAAQVVSGIGFIGGGCILLRGEIVRGLTTAASLWTVAAIGLAVGGGLYLGAAASTFIILIILAGLKPLEEWIQHRNKTYEFRITARRGAVSLDQLREALGYRANRITRYISSPSGDLTQDEIVLRMSRLPAADLDEIRDKLAALPDVLEAVHGKDAI